MVEGEEHPPISLGVPSPQSLGKGVGVQIAKGRFEREVRDPKSSVWIAGVGVGEGRGEPEERTWEGQARSLSPGLNWSQAWERGLTGLFWILHSHHSV